MRGELLLDTNLQSVAWGEGSLTQGLLLEKSYDMHIQCSRMTTAPGREVDISWSGEGIGNEVGEFNGRGQSSRLGGTEDDVPDGIVPYDPISIPSTSNLVVADACTRSLQGEGYFTVRMRMSISFFIPRALHVYCTVSCLVLI